MLVPSFEERATPAQFAEAMMRCCGWPPACSDAGRCLYGKCFEATKTDFWAACETIKDLRKQIKALETRIAKLESRR